MNIVSTERKGINPQVEPTRIQKIQKQSEQILDQSKLLSIFDPSSFDDASLFLKEIKAIQDEISNAFDPIIKAQHQAHKKSLETKRRYSLPLQKAEAIVKAKIKEYHLEQERIRREQEAKLRHVAKKAEEERLLQMAIEAEESGDTQEAEAMLAVSPIAPVISIPSQTDGNGIFYREVWKFRVINPDLVPDKYKILDERRIGAIVRALKDKTNIPGIEVYREKSVSGEI